jgi:ethanolamine permease
MENKQQLPTFPIVEIGLKKTLKTWHIWALAVGLVISGEYFGWNYGWGMAGTIGFFISTGIVTILYLVFVLSYAELTCMLPHAGGPYAFASRAFGPMGGRIAGYATLIEFLFATPAIAFAIGSYMHFLHHSIPVTYTAIGVYILFTGINILGINVTAFVGSIIAILAIAELLLYFIVVGPNIEFHNFVENNSTLSWHAIFNSLPYAVWFYLGIEGIAMVSEEVKEKKRSFSLSRGYILGFVTLAVLVFAVMIITGSLPNSQQFNKLDYPIPSAIGSVLGKNHIVSKAFAGIGLLGLIASFHAIIISYSRQIMALSRGKNLPSFLSNIHPRFRTPHWALIFGGIIGIAAIAVGRTDLLIVLSVLGATLMYIISMLSLIKLRKKEPHLLRPFKTYKYLPHFAIALTVLCLLAIIATNPVMTLWFVGIFGVLVIVFLSMGLHKKRTNEIFNAEAIDIHSKQPLFQEVPIQTIDSTTREKP